MERRLQKDEEFLLNHQDELNVNNPEQKEIYAVVNGKIDMCRQVLGYLEAIRQNPAIIIENLP